ncbi:MAG: UMP kinase [Synergistaceae bacterium]|jgi:uridylate kinase|nr:UMP kinase [Synergistaceae bacterium]
MTYRYKRVLLKLSGEILAGDGRFGLDYSAVNSICSEIASVARAGVEVAMVVGGGNFIRGAQAVDQGMDRVQADNMGMLATVMNALALQDALERIGTPTRVQTAIESRTIAEPFIRRRALRHLEKGRVVIFAAGVGSPYFSTDTAAALRASEIKADCLLKATKVNGIYDMDPKLFPDARRLRAVSYKDAIEMRLGVMDAAAFSLCMENEMPIVVFNMLERGSLEKLLLEGAEIGSTVCE